MKIVLWGARGEMGDWMYKQVAADPNSEIIAGFDLTPDPSRKIVADIASLPDNADCVVDFSRTSSIGSILAYALRVKCAVVLATTGTYDAAQTKMIQDAGKTLAILKSGNMSVGVNVMQRLVEQAAKEFGEAYDIEIIEAHHHRKVDSPSGTALMLLDSAKKGRGDIDKIQYGRHADNDRRDPHEIGMHSLRAGTIVGEHTVMFAGNDEIIEIKHTALSRSLFAGGALKAAKAMVLAKPGLYTTKDVL